MVAKAMITTDTRGNPFLARAYGLQSPDEAKALYDEWASTFDDDMDGASIEYVAPALVAASVLQHGGKIGGEIFDAGCGTGYVGVALAKLGATAVDGVDISAKMIELAAKKGVYRHLATADLTKPIIQKDAAYDVVTCVGTFTHGHVAPTPAMQEFVRVTKPGGLVVATVLNDIWTSGGYEAEAIRLQEVGKAELISADILEYRKGGEVKARMLVMRKL